MGVVYVVIVLNSTLPVSTTPILNYTLDYLSNHNGTYLKYFAEIRYLPVEVSAKSPNDV